MRILQISSARHLGGGERHFVDLTNGLHNHGHQVFVAIFQGSPLLPELRSLPNANILRLPFRKPFDLASAWKLRRFARSRDVEIVHAHLARDYPIATLAAQRGSCRLVLTRHVLFPMGKWHRLTRRRVSRVIAVSEAVAARLREQGIFEDRQITVVRNGINLERLGGVTRADRVGVLRVGLLGELSPVKGQADFIRAAAIISGRRADVEFVIAGRDNSADGRYGRELKQLIESRGLGNRIRLIETRIDVADFFSQLSLFVSASRSEAFGLAIIEAMAAGVPVVATASDGAREIIADGRTGRLVPIADAEALAGQIDELLNDAGQRDHLAAAARQMVAQEFSLDRMVMETESVYRDLLNG